MVNLKLQELQKYPGYTSIFLLVKKDKLEKEYYIACSAFHALTQMPPSDPAALDALFPPLYEKATTIHMIKHNAWWDGYPKADNNISQSMPNTANCCGPTTVCPCQFCSVALARDIVLGEKHFLVTLVVSTLRCLYGTQLETFLKDLVGPLPYVKLVWAPQVQQTHSSKLLTSLEPGTVIKLQP